MACQKFEKWISDSFDRELGEKNRRALEEHLSVCGSCRRYRQDITAIQQVGQGSPRAVLSVDYWKDFQERLQRRMISDLEGKREKPFLIRWRWAWAGAGLIIAGFIGLFLLLPRGEASPEIYVFSFEETFSRVYGEINRDEELAEHFNQVILASIKEETEGSDYFLPGFYEEHLLWERLTEEEIKLFEDGFEKKADS